MIWGPRGNRQKEIEEAIFLRQPPIFSWRPAESIFFVIFTTPPPDD